MMRKKELTKRQHDIYNMIRELMVTRGYGPTVREIGEHFGIQSPNGVMCHLRALERKGRIRRLANKSRAIELTGGALKMSGGLPLAGVVSAGKAMLAEEQHERMDFGQVFSGAELFVLEVRGESMIDAHIADGDYVVVRKQPTALSGDMVVARTPDGDATLKYWHPEKRRIRLQPANAEMEPIYVPNAEVVGVVVGVVRKLG